MDRILIILKKENGPRVSSAPALGLNTIRAATQENRSSGFPTRSDTNWPVQSQEQARSLKFRI